MGKPKKKAQYKNNVTPMFGGANSYFEDNAVHADQKTTPSGRKYRKNLVARSEGQAELLEAIDHNDVTIALGAPGSGKTFLSVAKGVEWVRQETGRRLVLCRPAVEAGERLGFLPGDMKEKVDPYMQPLYDALLERMSAKELDSAINDKRIEVAPIGFMRGRTLSNAYVVIDEAQNCTYLQLKMLYTRLGMGSKIIFTGDPDQSDIGDESGMVQFADRLDVDVPGISTVRLTAADVVRHPLLTRTLHLL